MYVGKGILLENDYEVQTVQDALKALREKVTKDIKKHNDHCRYDMCMQYPTPKLGVTCQEDLDFLRPHLLKINELLEALR